MYSIFELLLDITTSSSNMGRKKGRRRKSLKTNGFHMNELKESEIFCEPQAANFNRAIEAVPAENFDGRIENLPEHILLQIFKHTDGETMAKLRKVSRKFNEVVMENVKMLPKIEIRDVTLSARKLVTQATSTDCLVLSYDKCTSREKWVRFSKYLPAFDSNSAEIFQNQRKKLLDSEGLSKLWNFAISGFFLLDKLYFNETLIDTLIDLRFCIEELKIVYSELYDISVEKMVRFLENAKPVEFSMLNCDFPSNFITDRLIKSLENARQLTIVPRGPIHCGSVTDRSLYYLKNNHNGAEMPNAVDFGLQFSTNITENGLCQLLEVSFHYLSIDIIIAKIFH